MNKKRIVVFAACTALAFINGPLLQAQAVDTLWLRQVDLTRSTQNWSLIPKATVALASRPLRVAGGKFTNGLGFRAKGALRVELDGKADRFYTLFGIDLTTDFACHFKR